MLYSASQKDNVAIQLPGCFKDPSINKVLVCVQAFVISYFFFRLKTGSEYQIMVQVGIPVCEKFKKGQVVNKVT